MACDVCRNGDLTTITFVTSGFTAEFTSISGYEQTVEVIDSTTLGLQTCREKCAGDKVDHGSIELEWCSNPDNCLVPGVDETFIITYPPSPAQSNGATLTFTGFMSRVKNPGDAAPDERMISSATVTIKCTPAPPVCVAGS